MRFLKRYFGIILVSLLSIWAVKPLFISGFFPIHDDTQVARVFEMGKMLKDGVFPVRWVPDLGYGYGYPIFNFYAPLAYYVGGLFTVFGFDALAATKIMMVLGIVLSGIFMYLLAREFWGKLGGIVSGLFYVYAPYHALDIYVRGDVAEFWAYAFVPLMFWGFYKVFKGGGWKWIVVGSLGYSGMILSHNLTAMMVTPFLAIVILLYCYIAYKKKKIFNTYYLILTTILGLTLSASYWIPALLEMKYTNVLSQVGGGADFRDHFVCVPQLWDSLWGFGGSAPGCMLDGMSFMIGKLHIIVSFAVLVLVLITLIKNKYYNFNKNYIIAVLSLAGFALSTFFTLEISRFVWETFPAMEFFQYPWRFLILASFFSSILSGAAVFLSSQFKVKSYLTALLLVFLLLFFNLKFFVPQTIFPAKASDFTNEIVLKWETSKTSDEFLPPNFKKPKSEKDIAKNPIPFKETTLEKVSNAVSFIGALALIIGIIIRYGKNKR